VSLLGNEESSELIPAQTDIRSPVLSSNLLENYEDTNLVANDHDKIPPLADYDLEEDSEDESLLINLVRGISKIPLKLVFTIVLIKF
jgi:hypothetical protein